MSEAAAEITIKRMRGDTWPFRVTMKSRGVLQPLSGYTVLLTVNRVKDPTDTTQQVLQMTGTVISDGVVEFTPTAEQADVVGSFFCDVQISNGAPGGTKTPAKGVYISEQDITK